MHVLTMPRGTGKTTQSIYLAQRDNLCLVVGSYEWAKALERDYEKLKTDGMRTVGENWRPDFDVSKPFTVICFSDLIDRNWRKNEAVHRCNGFILDDALLMLSGFVDADSQAIEICVITAGEDQ